VTQFVKKLLRSRGKYIGLDASKNLTGSAFIELIFNNKLFYH